ncbi:MAG: phenylalanine--tRNA ligase subunit beta [Deltaproteobacteria bacterium]|nr:phenylalanine--tRNA ligase subunit beta [Candidatus Zymogenaceae bacterium]
MKATIQWLSDFVDIDLEVHKLADLMTMSGFEVEAVEKLGEGLEKILVGEIIEVTPHPTMEGLTVSKVDAGQSSVTIVSSAPNIRVGLRAPLALPGVRLPGGIEVSKRVFEGVESTGVLLAEDEIALTADHTGVMELPGTARAGRPITEAMDLVDWLLDIGVTPNRGDCLSILGLAREISALTNVPLKKREIKIIEEGPDINTLASVQVIDKDLCPRYTARVVQDLKIGKSPFWMRLRLKRLDLRDISNVVDITNYVMLEYGQPMHAFDYHLLSGNKIVVKRAAKGQTFYTLDAVERTLDEDILMICDGEKPVAIGGVMGGANSEIQDDTTDVLVEAAYFHPPSIRRTAKKLGLPSEAAFRMERGVDPVGLVDAANRTAELMHDLAGGVVARGMIDILGEIPRSRPLTIRTSRTKKIMGFDVTAQEISQFLRRLQIEVQDGTGDSVTVLPPPYRMDLEREIDLIEEVARLKGFDKIPETLPEIGMEYADKSPIRALSERVSDVMLSAGFNEVITYSFVASDSFEKLGIAETDPQRNVILLKNPMNEDMAVMRTSLVPSIIKTCVTNINYLNYDVRIFEIARVFRPREKGLPEEKEHLCALISGKRYPKQWGAPPADVDFFDIKGIWETIVDKMGLLEIEYTDNGEYPYLDGEQSCAIVSGSTPIGCIGKVDQGIMKNFDLGRDAYILEVNLSRLLDCATREIAFRALSRFPSVLRDISMVVGGNVKSREIVETISVAGDTIIKDVTVFDMYQGKQIQENKKSLALTVRYQSEDRTLTDDEVNMVHGRVIDALKKRLDIQIR